MFERIKGYYEYAKMYLSDSHFYVGAAVGILGWLMLSQCSAKYWGG